MDILEQLKRRGFIDKDDKITTEGIEVLVNSPHFKEKPMPEDLKEGLEFTTGSGTIHIYSSNVYNDDHTLSFRSLNIWTEEEDTEEGNPCFLHKKEEVEALRNYLNRFIEEFF